MGGSSLSRVLSLNHGLFREQDASQLILRDSPLLRLRADLHEDETGDVSPTYTENPVAASLEVSLEMTMSSSLDVEVLEFEGKIQFPGGIRDSPAMLNSTFIVHSAGCTIISVTLQSMNLSEVDSASAVIVDNFEASSEKSTSGGLKIQQSVIVGPSNGVLKAKFRVTLRRHDEDCELTTNYMVSAFSGMLRWKERG